jgi:hypothetical protein
MGWDGMRLRREDVHREGSSHILSAPVDMFCHAYLRTTGVNDTVWTRGWELCGVDEREWKRGSERYGVNERVCERAEKYTV